MSWLCCGKQTSKRIFPYSIYHQFARADQEDPLKLQLQTVKHPSGANEAYDQWSRMKFKSRDFEDLRSTHIEEKTNFIDDDFPHSDESIAHGFQSESIKWQRVTDIVPKATFSTPSSSNSVEKFSSQYKTLQTALKLIARTYPTKFAKLVDQSLNPEGIYQFMFFVKGVIENVIINDYVPTIKGYSVFSGPVATNEVYPMLLEKAIAKATKGYANMPERVEDVLEMLYCGAICKTNLNDLSDKNEFSRTVKETLAGKGMCLLYSKTEEKIRDYGINENEVYNIIGEHSIKTKSNDEIILFELRSENKLSAWNGKFSAIDASWQLVQPEAKNQLFKRMKQNESFFVQESEIPRLFVQLLVYSDTETKNQDWLENLSTNSEPSFCKFDLSEKDEVFFRLSAGESIRQTLILCKIMHDEYVYVDGNFDSSCRVLEFKKELAAGQYLVCIFQDWVSKKEGQYAIYLASSTRIYLEPELEHSHFKFLEKLILSHSQSKAKESRKEKNSAVLKEFGYLESIGFGFVRVIIASEEINLVAVEVDRKGLATERWEVEEPYKNLSEIVVHKDSLIVLKNLTKRKESMLPKDLLRVKVDE